MILLWWLMPVPCQAIAFLAVLIAASALQTQPMQLHARRRVVASVARVEVCIKKHCKKKGSLKTLRIFEDLAPDGVEVLAADMSHTEHGCFDECMMGPNVRVDGVLDVPNGVEGLRELLLFFLRERFVGSQSS